MLEFAKQARWRRDGPRRLAAAALALSALLPARASAQGNPRLTPLGGRSALMGGTGVALGRDGAAPFLNPATVVRIDDASVAFSANIFSVSAYAFHDWYRPAGADPRFGQLPPGDTTLTDASFEVLPSTLCVFLPSFGPTDRRAGRQKLAACLGQPERDEQGFTAETYGGGTAGAVRTRQLQSLDRSWRRFVFSPTYSVQLTEGLAAGAALQGMVGVWHSHLNAGATTLDGGGGFVGTNFYSAARGTSVDFAGILGVTYKHGIQTVGVSFQLPSAHIYGEGSVHDFRQSSGTASQTVSRDAAGKFEAPSPARIALGSGTELEQATLEINVYYTFPRTAAVLDMTGGEIAATAAAGTANPFQVTRYGRAPALESTTGVIGIATGMEWFVAPQRFSLLGGAGFDLSGVRPSSVRDAVTQDHVGTFLQTRMQRIGLSGGVGSYGEAGHLLIGTDFSYGWGETLAPDAYQIPPRHAVADFGVARFLFVLAGSTNVRSLRRAVDDVLSPTR